MIERQVTPAFWSTVGLVLSLRFRLFARRLSGRRLIGSAVAALLAAGLAAGLGIGSFLLFSAVPAIRQNPVWQAFVLGLYAFLLSLFWVIWPVIAAQVDEAYEMGRLFVYPVPPKRLYLIQTAAALLEPTAVFFYPALVGAALGLAQTLRPGGVATVVLLLAYVLMNVAAGRCLLNAFLNVMKSRRSGEILFAFFLGVLGLAAFLPPVDASWLFRRLSGFGGTPGDLAILAYTARTLGSTPPGWLARGLAASAAGEGLGWIGAAAGMMALGGFTWLLGLKLLQRFYRGGRGLGLFPPRKKGQATSRGPRPGWSLPGLAGTISAVFEKEVRTLLGNPKGRMLFAVPFFLLILLKIIGAPQLFLYLWGDAWASVLLSLLGLYVLSVLSGQFFCNGFGYDGAAVRLQFLLPAKLSHWLLGRNLAQGLFACSQMAGLSAMLFLMVPDAHGRLFALTLCCFPFGLLVALSVGNLLSCRYPKRFHLTLARRDRPVGTSILWMLSALGACAVVTLLALGVGAGRGATLALPLLALPLAGAGIYRVLFPVALRWTIAEKERIIAAQVR